MTLLLVPVTVIALAALACSVLALRRTASAGRTRAARDQAAADLPEDAMALRQEVAALRAENACSFKHLAVVRYDAFTDTGGQLSWSVALLDDHGDGAVLTAINGRSDARTYTKSVTGWACEQQLSAEEADAIGRARPS